MRKTIILLSIMLLFISACGNNDNGPVDMAEEGLVEDLNTSQADKTDETMEEFEIDCDEGYVQVDDECLPIDPYNVIDSEGSSSEQEQIEAPVEEKKAPSVIPGKKVFDIEVVNYEFLIDGKKNPDIRVGVNDTVVINLKSTEGSHNWNVANFAARTKTLITNESTTIEFTAFEKGEYEYYCAVGKHRNIGQEGRFIVE